MVRLRDSKGLGNLLRISYVSLTNLHTPRVLIGQTNTLKCRISFSTLIRYSETISKRTIDGHCLLNQLILVNYKSNALMIHWGMGK